MWKGLPSIVVVSCLLTGLALTGCGPQVPKAIKIGINAPFTGESSKVGEGTKFAAQMWLADIKAAGGLEIGGKKYQIELVIEDNQSRADAAVKANTKMITEDEVLVIVGPQYSRQAIPAGEVANNYKTPMISPWSTSPETTRERPYVFRGCFLDPFQGPVAANFIKEEFGSKRAAVLYDANKDYCKGIAEFFKKAWEDLYGSDTVVAFETFNTKDADFRSQLTKIRDSGAEVLFTPQYYNEVALIVQQAHQLGWDKPIVGSDRWGSVETVNLCGQDCYGLFFSTHFAAVGAKGATKAFINRYKQEHGYVPDDVGALTWDCMHIVQEAIQSCGEITGDLKHDRQCVRNAMARIKEFEGITGKMTFTQKGDPVKCAVIAKINDQGAFEFYKFVCP